MGNRGQFIDREEAERRERDRDAPTGVKPFHELMQHDQNMPRYQRAVRFANTIASIMRDFVPRDREAHRSMMRYLTELGWDGNIELLNVPAEVDALTKLELERAMIDDRIKRFGSGSAGEAAK